MKKLLVCLVFCLLFSIPAGAALKDTTLKYYSPKSGTFDAKAVTFKWTIHSWDPVVKVVLLISKVGKTGLMEIPFKGDEAKKVSYTATNLLPDSEYIWSLSVTTTAGEGAFGYFLGHFNTK